MSSRQSDWTVLRPAILVAIPAKENEYLDRPDVFRLKLSNEEGFAFARTTDSSRSISYPHSASRHQLYFRLRYHSYCYRPQKTRRDYKFTMGGLNLEVFKFGMYVMFPIGIMFYFGTNLDERFAVPDFWPKPEQANRVPFEKEEIHAELQRLRTRRLYLRDRRLEAEASMRAREDATNTGGNDEGRSS